ncbi:hypothetical protein ACN28S_37970 [Cystobacter fuscus]
MMHANIGRAEVPREALVFQAEMARREAAQRDPGQPQKDHGMKKTEGQAPGRYARTHQRGTVTKA